jgi:hypothetical protein
MALGVAVMISLIAVPFRKLDPGIPPAGTCSVAIAAACQHADPEMVALPLKYGVLQAEEHTADVFARAYGVDTNAIRRRKPGIGLSSGPVAPLQDGAVYC